MSVVCRCPGEGGGACGGVGRRGEIGAGMICELHAQEQEGGL